MELLSHPLSRRHDPAPPASFPPTWDTSRVFVPGTPPKTTQHPNRESRCSFPHSGGVCPPGPTPSLRGNDVDGSHSLAPNPNPTGPVTEVLRGTRQSHPETLTVYLESSVPDTLTVGCCRCPRTGRPETRDVGRTRECLGPGTLASVHYKGSSGCPFVGDWTLDA